MQLHNWSGQADSLRGARVRAGGCKVWVGLRRNVPCMVQGVPVCCAKLKRNICFDANIAFGMSLIGCSAELPENCKALSDLPVRMPQRHCLSTF